MESASNLAKIIESNCGSITGKRMHTDLWFLNSLLRNEGDLVPRAAVLC